MSHIIDMFGNITISKKINRIDELDLVSQFEEFYIEEKFEQPSYQEDYDKMSEDDSKSDLDDLDNLKELNENEKEFAIEVENWDGKTGNDYVEHDYDSEEQDFDYWTSENDFED